MPMKRYKPEQIVSLLRQIEVEIANGKTTPRACKEAEITQQTYYRWRKEFGGLKLDQAKRMKELERENAKLNRLVAELSLEKQILLLIAAFCRLAKSLSHSELMEWLVGRWGSNHSDPLKPRNLFILRYAQDIKNAQNARRRYTAGTPIA
jgi:putative transposase